MSCSSGSVASSCSFSSRKFDSVNFGEGRCACGEPDRSAVTVQVSVAAVGQPDYRPLPRRALCGGGGLSQGEARQLGVAQRGGELWRSSPLRGVSEDPEGVYDGSDAGCLLYTSPSPRDGL